MDRAQKQEMVAELQRTFGSVNLVVVTQQTGLSVAEVSDLRRRMRAAGAGYKVTKNRLTRLALEGTQFQALQGLFTGPTAIAFSVDPVAAAKVCVEFAKANQKLTVVGGALAGAPLSTAEVVDLASLPSLDELRARLIGVLQAPATKLVGVVQAPAAQLCRVFGAYAAREDAA